MKNWNTRKNELKEKAIEYIKKELDICPEYKLNPTFYDYFAPHDELQLCEVHTLEYISGEYIARYTGERSGENDSVELDELTVDLACNLADALQSHLYHEKVKDEINTDNSSYSTGT